MNDRPTPRMSGYEFYFHCGCPDDGKRPAAELDVVTDGYVFTCPFCGQSYKVSIDEVGGGDGDE